MRVHCLGGGLVGSFVTRRLVEAELDVHLFDVVQRDTKANFHLGDALVADHSAADIIVNMLPGSLGNRMTALLKGTGQRVVDLSFSESTPDEFRDVNSSILWDVGIAPGLSNMLVAMAHRELGSLDEVSIKVGGNPQQPDGEWSYMAPFSPHDVIAEYIFPVFAFGIGSKCAVFIYYRVFISGTFVLCMVRVPYTKFIKACVFYLLSGRSFFWELIWWVVGVELPFS